MYSTEVMPSCKLRTLADCKQETQQQHCSNPAVTTGNMSTHLSQSVYVGASPLLFCTFVIKCDLSLCGAQMSGFD